MKTPKGIIFEYSSKTKSELIKVEQLKEIYEGSFTLMDVIGMIESAQKEAKVFSSNAVLAVTSDSENNNKESEVVVCDRCGGSLKNHKGYIFCKDEKCGTVYEQTNR